MHSMQCYLSGCLQSEGGEDIARDTKTDELDEEDDSPEEKEGEENQEPDDSKSGKAPNPGDKE